jgi:hypothetical protein
MSILSIISVALLSSPLGQTLTADRATEMMAIVNLLRRSPSVCQQPTLSESGRLTHSFECISREPDTLIASAVKYFLDTSPSSFPGTWEAHMKVYALGSFLYDLPSNSLVPPDLFVPSNWPGGRHLWPWKRSITGELYLADWPKASLQTFAGSYPFGQAEPLTRRVAKRLPSGTCAK